jgi:hypothetical protein
MKCDSIKIGMVSCSVPPSNNVVTHVCPIVADYHNSVVILHFQVKHPEVAQFLGGRLYDCVFKFNEA